VSRFIPSLLYGMLGVANVSAAVAANGGGVAVVYHLLSAGLWFMFLTMTLVRSRSQGRDRSPLAVAAALFATVASIPLSLGGTTAGPRLLLANVLLLAGMGFALVSIAHLGRCFGVLADARGLVTQGPYRVVRHPLYLGELASMLGLALGAERVWLTVPTWATLITIQAVRAFYEERTLATAFPQYTEYIAVVPYRIVPRIY
jgi:protein-S-isoprenylcysteine O-methyltransferase Ste14